MTSATSEMASLETLDGSAAKSADDEIAELLTMDLPRRCTTREGLLEMGRVWGRLRHYSILLEGDPRHKKIANRADQMRFHLGQHAPIGPEGSKRDTRIEVAQRRISQLRGSKEDALALIEAEHILSLLLNAKAMAALDRAKLMSEGESSPQLEAMWSQFAPQQPTLLSLTPRAPRTTTPREPRAPKTRAPKADGRIAKAAAREARIGSLEDIEF